MPAMYAHYVFGDEVLPQLDSSIKRIVNSHRELFNLGLQGPDFYFYDQLFYLKKKSLALIGSALHRQSCGSLMYFFERNGARHLDSESLAYVVGVVGHFSLDSTCHPHIDEWVETLPYNHMRLETEFDRLLLERNGENARSFPLGDCFASTKHEREVIAKLYDGHGSARDIAHLVRDYAFLKNIMRTPWDGQYDFYQKMLTTFKADKLGGVFMGKKDTLSDYTNPRLMALFEQAKPVFVKLASNFMDHHFNGAPLDSYFDRDFEVLPEGV